MPQWRILHIGHEYEYEEGERRQYEYLMSEAEVLGRNKAHDFKSSSEGIRLVDEYVTSFWGEFLFLLAHGEIWRGLESKTIEKEYSGRKVWAKTEKCPRGCPKHHAS